MKRTTALVSVALIVLCLAGYWYFDYRPGPVSGPQAQESPIQASARGQVFHRSDCRWARKIDPDNLLGYRSAADAMAAGLRPCKICKPPQAP